MSRAAWSPRHTSGLVRTGRSWPTDAGNSCGRGPDTRSASAARTNGPAGDRGSLLRGRVAPAPSISSDPASTTIDLSPGLPDLTAFPRRAWLRAERVVLAKFSAADLAYGDPRGAPVFRVAVARWLARNRGIQVDPAEVIIVAGVAQALALLARVLARSGITRIAVEDPGSFGAREQLQAWEIRRPHPSRSTVKGWSSRSCTPPPSAAVLLTPAHQFPTGVVLG